MTELEIDDMQGILVRGFGKLEHACFLLLGTGRPELARGYLRELAPRINTAARPADTHALQIAFTGPGLAALELPAHVHATFSRELLEGMHDPVRSESLGDRGANDPARWKWGAGGEIHAVLLVYAIDDETLQSLIAAERARFVDGFVVLHEKSSRMLADQKEHFGWRDGLSMPKFRGVPEERPRTARADREQQAWTGPLAAGEFVLGYPNEYGSYSESPVVPLGDDPHDLLAATPDGTAKDLGKNGTYLVFREIVQHVRRLWRYLDAESREPAIDDTARAVALGSKMVGRWPGGAPLATSPRDDEAHAHDNEFTYDNDRRGHDCPIGAHIRRANPRQMISSDRTAFESAMRSRKHQMIRRGRTFGDAMVPALDPAALVAEGRTLQAYTDDEHDHSRGLHFLCLVGHLMRQFELVQRAWIQHANFCGLYKDGDPISAGRVHGGANPNDEFTVPATPFRRKYHGLPQFTTLVGGAYFFLPGIRALRYLAR